MNCCLCEDSLGKGKAVCLSCAGMSPSAEGASATYFRPPEMSRALRDRFKDLFQEYLADVEAVRPDLDFAQISVEVRPYNESYFSVTVLEKPKT